MCKWMRSRFFASGIHPPCKEGLSPSQDTMILILIFTSKCDDNDCDDSGSNLDLMTMMSDSQ